MGLKQIILKEVDSKIKCVSKLYGFYQGHLYLMLKQPILGSLATNLR